MQKRFVAALGLVAILNVSAGSVAIAQQDGEDWTTDHRVAGADRYSTAVELSRLQWEDGLARTVFLANGETLVDALAAGASTDGEGPVLLVKRDELPPAVAEEITRLQPCRIVVLGGTAAISQEVEQAARARTSRQGCS